MNPEQPIPQQTQPVQPNTPPQAQPVGTFGNPPTPGLPLSSDTVVPLAPPPSKSSKSRMVFVIAIVIALIALGVGGWVLFRKSPKTPTPSAQQNQTEQTQQKNINKDVIALSDNLSVLEPPLLNLPAGLTDWKTDTTLAKDTVGLIHKDGCKLNYVPDKDQATTNLDNDSAATDAALSRKINSLADTGNVTDVTYGTVTISVANSTKKIEFKTANLTVATQYIVYRMSITGRQINGYIVGINFYCPRDVFSSKLNDGAIQAMTIDLKTKETL